MSDIKASKLFSSSVTSNNVAFISPLIKRLVSAAPPATNAPPATINVFLNPVPNNNPAPPAVPAAPTPAAQTFSKGTFLISIFSACTSVIPIVLIKKSMVA